MINNMHPNFLCKCGHRNKMHASLEDSLEYYNHNGRMCIEYANYPDPEGSEKICTCNDFRPDNLKTLEMMQIQPEKIS